MKHKREFDTIYFHNPQSLGGELLPLHHVTEEDGVDGVKGATGSSSDSVSALILVVFRSVSCILHFSTALSQNRPREGGIYSQF
jgi:hypothetical protein